MRHIVIAFLMVLSLASSSVVATEPAPLESLAFLLGEWESTGSGQPGSGTGTAVFSRGLQDRVILRKSYADYPPAGGKPGYRHDDLMVIHADAGGAVRADYYDSEGHVIRYTVELPAANQAVFLGEATANAPRFRLTYKLEGDGSMTGEFAMAPPGSSDDFKPYLHWTSHKAGDGAK
ncbi:MAG TPA: hypothetical protein VNI57_12935 [Candidatus Saccharimonadales bacterium]|nr:hypothetical protein [Candidatus Saccharimonadales bacterium]